MHALWRQSKCKGHWLHRYQLARQFSEGSEEVCEICHDKRFFKVRNGKVNNREYLDYHLRSALPKYHNYFKKEYGN